MSFGLESQRRAGLERKAALTARSADQAPVARRTESARGTSGAWVFRDQGLRETTMAGLGRAEPVLGAPRASSQISDGAAAVLWMDEAWRARPDPRGPGSSPRHSSAPSPYCHLDGPVQSTTEGAGEGRHEDRRLSSRSAGVHPVSWARVHEADMDRVSVSSGAIALGASGGWQPADHHRPARAERGQSLALITMRRRGPLSPAPSSSGLTGCGGLCGVTLT